MKGLPKPTVLCLILTISFHLIALDAKSLSQLRGIQNHGVKSQLPASILSRIRTINTELTSVARILKTKIIHLSNQTLALSVNLSRVLAGMNIFIMSELYLELAGQHGASSQSTAQDLWIQDSTTNTHLARVSLKLSKTGFMAINLRNIVADWWKRKKPSAVLRLEISSGPLTANQSLSLKTTPFVVVYAYDLNRVTLPPPSCNSHKISFPVTDDVMFPRNVTSLICSPLDDVTFPFNASSVFDVGASIRKYLKSSPLPSDSPVLRNPLCCHAVRFAAMHFFTRSRGAVRLRNTRITKCGCRDS